MSAKTYIATTVIIIDFGTYPAELRYVCIEEMLVDSMWGQQFEGYVVLSSK